PRVKRRRPATEKSQLNQRTIRQCRGAVVWRRRFERRRAARTRIYRLIHKEKHQLARRLLDTPVNASAFVIRLQTLEQE
ncbi:MAG: hypothetical protein Q8O70_09510, partial [Burkholderiales bacterium]|nr:hypothetical protein [Burkholderiales bacterium]